MGLKAALVRGLLLPGSLCRDVWPDGSACLCTGIHSTRPLIVFGSLLTVQLL